jgi:hypothetical protein
MVHIVAWVHIVISTWPHGIAWFTLCIVTTVLLILVAATTVTAETWEILIRDAGGWVGPVVMGHWQGSTTRKFYYFFK